MKVILLKDIKGVGRRFEEKEVSDGHATNFLIPKNLVVPVTGGQAKKVQELKRQEEKKRAHEANELETGVAHIAGTKITIRRKANDQGHLFEKITLQKIIQILKEEKGITLGTEDLLLENPIKEVGTFEISINLAQAGKTVKFTLVVEPS